MDWTTTRKIFHEYGFCKFLLNDTIGIENFKETITYAYNKSIHMKNDSTRRFFRYDFCDSQNTKYQMKEFISYITSLFHNSKCPFFQEKEFNEFSLLFDGFVHQDLHFDMIPGKIGDSVDDCFVCILALEEPIHIRILPKTHLFFNNNILLPYVFVDITISKMECFIFHILCVHGGGVNVSVLNRHCARVHVYLDPVKVRNTGRIKTSNIYYHDPRFPPAISKYIIDNDPITKIYK